MTSLSQQNSENTCLPSQQACPLPSARQGWKRVIDAAPYIEENVYLRDYIDQMKMENARLQKRLAGEKMMSNPSIRKTATAVSTLSVPVSTCQAL